MVLFVVLGVLVLSCVLKDIFEFLLRKKGVVGLDMMLATQSIEARARRKGRAGLYDW